MATESLLPLFHENPAERMADVPSEGDDFLAELLSGAGDDLLASLLEPDPGYLGQLSPPLSTSPHHLSIFHPPLSTTHSTFAQDRALLSGSSEAVPLSVLPSPPHDGYISDTSSLHRAHSPYSCTSYSPVDMLGNSPVSVNHSDVMVTSSCGLPANELDALLGSLSSASSGGSSSEVKIDVEPAPGVRGIPASPSNEGSSGSRKAATLVLSEEEKQLLTAEGISLPTDLPLTKQEQKHLKRVQRKIKNKVSAQESRRRKKDYVEGLEERVQRCTDTNHQLKERVGSLESENTSLMEQLRKLRSVVAQIYPSKLQAGTILMVLSLSFSLLLFPWPRPLGHTPSSHSVTVHSRTLLFTETDEFGNIIDPETGRIVSEQGGLSPTPPYPWSLQTPAFLAAFSASLSRTLSSHVTHKADFSHTPSFDGRQDL